MANTTSGLDAIPVEDTQTTETPTGGLSVKIGPKGNLVPSAKEIVADPSATKDLLANMERLIAEKSSPWKSFQDSLARASAWGSGGVEGPAATLAAINKQQNEEGKDLFNMQQQLASYKAAQSSAANDAARLAALTGGAGGVGGAGGAAAIPADVQARMQAARTDSDRLAILDEWRKGRITESTKKEFSPQMATIVKVFNPLTNKVEEMTQADAEKILTKKPELYRGVSQQPVVSDDAALRVAARESGGRDIGYHDLTKGTAYGTYGITDAAYKDVQAANPRFKDRPITSLNKDEQTEAFNTYRGLAQNQLSKLGVEPSAQNLDLAHFLGPTGAANYIKTGNISSEAAAANGGAEKATQIATGILGGKPIATSGATGLEPAPKQPAAKAAGYVGPLMPDGSKPTTRDEYDLALANQKLKAEESIKTEEKGRAAELEATGKTAAVRSDAIREARDNVGTNRANAQRLIDLSTSNPKAFGVLQETGLLAAAVKAIEGGVTVPGSGTAKLSNMEEAALRLRPGIKKEDLRAAEEAARIFAELQLNAAKVVLKGQGAVSDAERELVAKMTGSTKNSPETIKKFAQWYKTRADYDEKMGNAYEDWKAQNRNGQFQDFESTAQYKAIRADHAKQVEKLVKANGQEGKNEKPAHPGAALLDLYPERKK